MDLSKISDNRLILNEAMLQFKVTVEKTPALSILSMAFSINELWSRLPEETKVFYITNAILQELKKELDAHQERMNAGD